MDRDLGYVVPHFNEAKNVTGDVVQERIDRSLYTEVTWSAGGYGHDSGHAEDEAGNDMSHYCKERYFGPDPSSPARLPLGRQVTSSLTEYKYQNQNYQFSLSGDKNSQMK